MKCQPVCCEERNRKSSKTSPHAQACAAAVSVRSRSRSKMQACTTPGRPSIAFRTGTGDNQGLGCGRATRATASSRRAVSWRSRARRCLLSRRSASGTDPVAARRALSAASSACCQRALSGSSSRRLRAVCPHSLEAPSRARGLFVVVRPGREDGGRTDGAKVVVTHTESASGRRFASAIARAPRADGYRREARTATALTHEGARAVCRVTRVPALRRLRAGQARPDGSNSPTRCRTTRRL